MDLFKKKLSTDSVTNDKFTCEILKGDKFIISNLSEMLTIL